MMDDLNELSDLEIIKAIAEIESDTDTLEIFSFYDAPEHQSDFYLSQRESYLITGQESPCQ